MTLPKELEEEVYEIISAVRVPCRDDVGHDEMSLFDFMMHGNNDDEGVLLADKLVALLTKVYAKGLTQGRAAAIAEVRGMIDEVIIFEVVASGRKNIRAELIEKLDEMV